MLYHLPVKLVFSKREEKEIKRRTEKNREEQKTEEKNREEKGRVRECERTNEKEIDREGE